ncbi:MAG: hypothetical protein ACD_76C00018G0006 [uncultured bacterium]|nr:MAG: hypothetical protein ACD_76C00018G0006 [uncultured bacterium]HBD05036.1 2,3-bisphosphoglycerate-independent phosphoglycerate mutase [Candidatus Uhrbacteria bacterium]
MRKPAVLLILDGWGVAPDNKGNAITQAQTPVISDLIKKYPVMTLRASGESVGLSWGEMGNSEVGHIAIGSGRVHYQTLPRINKDIESGVFFSNPAFIKAGQAVKKNKSKLHLIGMVSPGRVHSTDSHCKALLEFAKKQKIKDVFVHAILDGRDTVYNSSADFISELQKNIKEIGVGAIASLLGRYYAMDRDSRWDRIQKAYLAIAKGESEYMEEDPLEAIKKSYERGVYDEEFEPTVITHGGKPIVTIEPGDAVIFFNFRPDRARQLTEAFVLPSFAKFEREYIENLTFVTMIEYEANLPVDVAFPPEPIEKCLSEVLSEAGIKQMHIAETEKYAHVTFFINGTKEQPFKGEERIIVPSPKVASYDKEPEMSAREVADRAVKEIKEGGHDFYVVNFANCDMVGHTGDLGATKKAVAVVDECVGRVVQATLEKGGNVFLTADHGNAENEINLQTGEKDKEHTTNPVPFIIIGEDFEGRASAAGEVPGGDLSLMPQVGTLADVAPTILSVLGIEKPIEMTGQSLL